MAINGMIQTVEFAPGNVALVGYQAPLSVEGRDRARTDLEEQIEKATGFRVPVVMVASDLNVLAVAVVTKP